MRLLTCAAALAPGKVLWEGGDTALPSVLNGDHLARLIARHLGEECAQPAPSSPMTLFLTATALYGAVTLATAFIMGIVERRTRLPGMVSVESAAS